MTVTTSHIPHTHTHISTCTQGNAQKTAMHTGFRKLCTAAVNVDIVFTEQIKEKSHIIWNDQDITFQITKILIYCINSLL